jgi:hypothetical protein
MHESRDTLAASRPIPCSPVSSPGRIWNPKNSWFLDKRDFTPSENRPQLNDSCAASANERAQSAHSRSSKTQQLPFLVGARGFEPRASWSQKLLDSPKTAISEQFPKSKLHEVHRISQTAHNLGTLTGGPTKTHLNEVRFARRSPPVCSDFVLPAAGHSDESCWRSGPDGILKTSRTR